MIIVMMYTNQESSLSFVVAVIVPPVPYHFSFSYMEDIHSHMLMRNIPIGYIITIITIKTEGDSALGRISKDLGKGLEDLKIRGQEETIEIIVLSRSTRILRWVEETCCHSNSREKPSANAGEKNSLKSKILLLLLLIIIITIILCK